MIFWKQHGGNHGHTMDRIGTANRIYTYSDNLCEKQQNLALFINQDLSIPVVSYSGLNVILKIQILNSQN